MLGFFFYVGFEVGYGGWISTYGSMSGVATKEQAAYCSSIFWCFRSIGRLLAVPFAIRYPTNIQFKILIYGCICSMLISNLLLLMNLTKLVIYGCSALYGLSMSAIYPLLISMPSYLKFRLSARNTSNYVLMGAFGESLMPVLLGYGISLIGPNTLFVASLVYAFILLFIYHQIMKFELSPV
jgi:FHS family Na+ dependent glucose MFS transporter 1